jgi:hypothetical protein
MATIIHPKNFLHFLHCSCPAHAPLVWKECSKPECQSCHKVFPVTENILELVDISLLDPETARELRGNTHTLSDESIRKMANKGGEDDYGSHLQQGNFIPLSRYLSRVNCSQIFALGAGTGYEIKHLSAMQTLDTVFCSDLSYSALYITPYTLESIDIKIGLFTSNLDDCPIQNREIPVLIYEALHHTSDMHVAIEHLLIKGYKHIFLVEPANNFLIKWLAIKGIAQRVEYSGVKPGRLDLKKLYSLCKNYGYKSSVTTTWHFPKDYYTKLFGSSPLLQSAFLLLLKAFSAATNPFKFGNEAICYLQKDGDL